MPIPPRDGLRVPAPAAATPPAAPPVWVAVPAGICRYGDARRPVPVPALLWTRTLLTWDQLRTGQAAESVNGGAGHRRGDLPATGLDWEAAARAAEAAGGRLPRAVEWEWMAAGTDSRRWPWGDEQWTPERARLRPDGHGCAAAVGAHPAGATPQGVLDVAGNVWEWTASSVLGRGYQLRGGSFASPPVYARCTFINAAPAELRSPGIGVRVVRAA